MYRANTKQFALQFSVAWLSSLCRYINMKDQHYSYFPSRKLTDVVSY